MASSSISIEYETSTAITSSTLTDSTLCLVSANRDFGLGAATPATSPPTIAPATSTAPTETHQRMAALPSFHEHGDTQNASRKAETCNGRSSSGGPYIFRMSPIGTNRTSRAGPMMSVDRRRPEVAVEGKTGAIDSTRNFNSYLDRRRFLSPPTLPALQATALLQAWKRENLP